MQKLIEEKIVNLTAVALTASQMGKLAPKAEAAGLEIYGMTDPEAVKFTWLNPEAGKANKRTIKALSRSAKE